jgi:holo-[acyl-carrier protein] synthase
LRARVDALARCFFKGSDYILERFGVLQYDTPQEESMSGQDRCSVGIDLVSVTRIEGMMGRWGRKFLERVFTAGEIEYCSGRHTPARSFAARFAAKEAFVKAVSAGRPGGIRYRDVEVAVGERGRPLIRPRGAAEVALGGGHAALSLSHEGDLAVAVVIVCPEVTS